jgi:pimeloyl-ACP methyl ester carboxylesterase
MAKAEGLTWPPPPVISVRQMLLFIVSRPMQITSVSLPGEPCTRTKLGDGYFDIPSGLVASSISTNAEGRLIDDLRKAAQLRDGNKILEMAATLAGGNYLNPGSTPQEVITAIAQLAVTGSNAFAAWQKNPTTDLTSFLTAYPFSMPLVAAEEASRQIMADFSGAQEAVRNPEAGINRNSLRQSLRNGSWIAVSGEDDPPDFPVNVSIAKYPQYHLAITVPTPKGPSSSVPVATRCIIASSRDVAVSDCNVSFTGTAPTQPTIPPGDEVILYIHGEGSRAEEALDFIPALFTAGAAAGRSFTVIAFDQPSCGYSTMVPHLSVAPMPPTSGGLIDTTSFAGSPILDFVESAIVAFVEQLPFDNPLTANNPLTAVVGGSLGGHMALRLAASQPDWVRNVVAWSPASVMDHTFTVLGVPPISQRVVSDPVLAARATDGPSPPWPASVEDDSLRSDFFSTVWDQDTANVAGQYGVETLGISTALVESGVFASLGATTGPVAATIAATVSAALLGLTPVPAQPLMWYRDDWPSGVPTVQLAPWGQSAMVGPAKAIHIQESRRDRREIYNADFRRWHWRICEEMLSYTFDPRSITKPLLLLVGEKDDYPDVHFFSNVTTLAQSLNGSGRCLTVPDTGHSIHNERPKLLAEQVLAFAPSALNG